MSVTLHHVIDGPTEIDAADAPVLVLIGSLGSTLDMWRPNIPELGRRMRVVRLDPRGHGGSPAPAGDYSMADLADDVVTTLDTLGVDRFHYCGLSLGGMIGQYVAAEHPERVRTLTLCCTSSWYPDSTPWIERRAAVLAEGTASIADAVVARWYTPDWAAAHPDVVAESVGWIASTSDVGYAGCCAAIGALDSRERLRTVVAPTLVVGGADDLATPVDPHATTIAAAIPGARLEVLPAAAHLATVERTAAATRLILTHAGV